MTTGHGNRAIASAGGCSNYRNFNAVQATQAGRHHNPSRSVQIPSLAENAAWVDPAVRDSVAELRALESPGHAAPVACGLGVSGRLVYPVNDVRNVCFQSGYSLAAVK